MRAERFHVWAVRTIDEGIELLTGRAAGRRAADGSYPAESVHGFVAARLARYADRLRALGDFGPSIPGATAGLVEERC
ncbi:MAG: hypothetical protein ACXVRZ_18010 [Gaiellaceae bacterium]